MNKYHISRLTTLLIACIVSVNLFAAPKPKKEVYIPMDYSTCGYHASERAIPDIPVTKYVVWQDGDCSSRIQQAIDEVALLKPDKNGYRGCILLGEGVFKISKAIRRGCLQDQQSHPYHDIRYRAERCRQAEDHPHEDGCRSWCRHLYRRSVW